MHDAYDLSPLLKLTVQIESVAGYDDFLFVGTKQGHLLIYSVIKKLEEPKPYVQLLCYNKHFSKKPIQQIQVVSAHHLLISLSDNVISFYNIPNIQSPATLSSPTILPKTKGATLFTLDVTKAYSLTGEVTVVVRLAVAIKRKIQLYCWMHGEFKEMPDELTAPDLPISMGWLQDAVCIGSKSEYYLLNINNKNRDNLFPIGKAPAPIITGVEKGVFALCQDSQSIFINSLDKTTLKYAVKWSDYPTGIAFDKPFLIALLPEVMEVKTVEPNQFVQSIPCSKLTLVTHARPGRLYIANSSRIWSLQAVPVSQQIKRLLEGKQFELALKVAKDWEWEDEEQKNKSVRGIQTLYAHHLFVSKQFNESLKQFLNLKTNPVEVIKLFPDLLNSSEPEPSQVNDQDLEASLKAFIEYLTEVHGQLISCNPPKPSLLAIVDTTLLKCYLQTNDAMISPLLRLNKLHFNETEKLLKKYKKINELVILYQNNNLPEQALALLKEQRNVDKTITYLQQLGADHFNLIKEYAEWVLKEDPVKGLSIFTEDINETELLPRREVVSFLSRLNNDLTIPYVEHAIHEWKDEDPILHTNLVNMYREKYLKLKAESDSNQEVLNTRKKLYEFLEKSNFYSAKTLITLFPKDDLQEEKAILLGKQGRHEQALSFYVCILNDLERAKKYCEQVYNAQSAGYEEVYVLLMRILISTPENWLAGLGDKPPVVKQDLHTALSILRTYADRIDPSQALSVLPDNVPLKEIRLFLIKSIRKKLRTRRHIQIVKGLVYSEYLQVHEHRMRSEAKPVLVTEIDNCAICSKRFTNQSVLARVPAGIIHYGCQKGPK